MSNESLTPLDLVSAHPWRHVVFTTYALSLSFFEAVILDALVRGGTRAQPIVLSDVHGVRESLGEQGAQRVGKDYEVEPIAVSGGVFHPKISVLASDDECHLLVGSGNLTFNGWGGNCEVIEHLHPRFAASAIVDAAGFFERLSESERVWFGARANCVEVASFLRRSAQGHPESRDIRFVHNLDTSITEQIVKAADDLGGATRLVAAAPFWDSGSALDNLCRLLRLEEAFIHAHAGGRVESAGVSNWPRKANIAVRAVRVVPFEGSSEAKRRLHAKTFEILCRRGRLLVSGSANGSTAALGPDINIEACVLRVQAERVTGWKHAPTNPPDPPPIAKEREQDEQNRTGVLRAVLDGEHVAGQVLTPRMSGPASIYYIATLGPELLTDVVLDSNGKFDFTAPNLETSSWRGGRLVLRLVNKAGKSAEGFVSLASFAEIARHGGLVTRRLLAVIFGNETPADVTAILSWFLEDTSRLLSRDAFQGHGESQKSDDSEQLIPVAALNVQFIDALHIARPSESGGRHWSRFIDQVMAAFREARGKFGEGRNQDPDDDKDRVESASDGNAEEAESATQEAYETFNQLFEVLTIEGAPARHAEMVFDLTSFICARLNPEMPRVKAWLSTAIRTWLNAGVRPERREEVAAAILTILGTDPQQPDHLHRARQHLLRLGRDLLGPPPVGELVHNYRTVLRERMSFVEMWASIRKVRTYPEQVKAYLQALQSGEDRSNDYPDLPVVAEDAWPALARALKSPAARKKLLFLNGSGEACPEDYTILPKHEIDRLRTTGIAIARGCCGKVVIRREE